MAKYLSSALIVVLLVFSKMPLRADSIPEIVAKAKPAVVEIVAMDKDGSPTKLGTGFFVSSDGLVVTNFHVIQGATSLAAVNNNGALFLFENVVAQPASVDIAILKFQAHDVPFLSLGQSTNKVEGEKVIVIGNPTGLTGTVSDGIISAFRRNHSLIQITAPISQGSSGSPVMDENGQVIGVATLLSEEGQNLNFAIPVESVSQAIASTARDEKPISLAPVVQRQEIRRFAGHTQVVTSVAFSPDGRSIVSGSFDQTIRFWDLETGREIRQILVADDYINSSVLSVEFSPDGRYVLSEDRKWKTCLWDVQTGREIRRFPGTMSARLSPDGLNVASDGSEQTIVLWDVETGKEIRRFKTQISWPKPEAFSPNGHFLIFGNARLWAPKTIVPCLYLLDVSTGQEIRQFIGHTDSVQSVAFSSVWPLRDFCQRRPIHPSMGCTNRPRNSPVCWPHEYGEQRGILPGWPLRAFRKLGRNHAFLGCENGSRDTRV